MTDASVRIRDLVMVFGQGDAAIEVLRHVSLDLDVGRMTFITGPSGCGKTTLLSIVAGILTPTSGTVELLGTEITRLRADRLARFRAAMLGFVFQQFNLLPALSAVENAAVPLLLNGWRWSAARRKSAETLDRLGLGAHLTKLPCQLSGGQQQRVAIARAVVHDPMLLVCDEPTASLDSSSGASVMSLLREVALVPGRAALVVTHDDRIMNFADRLARMNDGRLRPIEAAPVNSANRTAA